jgi:hypothetical protein
LESLASHEVHTWSLEACDPSIGEASFWTLDFNTQLSDWTHDMREFRDAHDKAELGQGYNSREPPLHFRQRLADLWMRLNAVVGKRRALSLA